MTRKRPRGWHRGRGNETKNGAVAVGPLQEEESFSNLAFERGEAHRLSRARRHFPLRAPRLGRPHRLHRHCRRRCRRRPFDGPCTESAAAGPTLPHHSAGHGPQLRRRCNSRSSSRSGDGRSQGRRLRRAELEDSEGPHRPALDGAEHPAGAQQKQTRGAWCYHA